MKNIPIRNKEVIELLEEVKTYYDDREHLMSLLRVNGSEKDADWFTSDEYRDQIINMDTDHNRYPETPHSI